MLKRVNGVLFKGDLGTEAELAVKAQNVPVEFARFEYDGGSATDQVIEGHPGCRFTLVSGIRQFAAIVDFGTGAPPHARYDLFQKNDVGVLVPVGESVTNGPTMTPIIGFGIDGVIEAVAVGARPAGRARRPAAARAAKRATKAPRARKSAKAAKASRSKKRTKAKTTAKGAKRPKAKRARTTRGRTGRKTR